MTDPQRPIPYRPPAKYPAQLVVMLSDPEKDRIATEARDSGQSQSERARRLLELGRVLEAAIDLDARSEDGWLLILPSTFAEHGVRDIALEERAAGR